MKEQKRSLLILSRVLLLVLILANMVFIFCMSHQNGEESGETSMQVTTTVAQTTIKDFEQKEQADKDKILTELNIPIRSLAHMAEFGALGTLVLLFLLTWEPLPAVKYLGAIAFSFLYACTDEWHQKLVGDGRAAQWKDVGIDML